LRSRAAPAAPLPALPASLARTSVKPEKGWPEEQLVWSGELSGRRLYAARARAGSVDAARLAAQAQWTDLKAGVKDGIERVKSLFS
jgi:hypothetical protein